MLFPSLSLLDFLGNACGPFELGCSAGLASVTLVDLLRSDFGIDRASVGVILWISRQHFEGSGSSGQVLWIL